MKVQKSITLHDQTFEFLSDCSLDSQNDPKCLFVKTTLNDRFHQQIHPSQSIDENHLKDFFTLPPVIIGITGTNGKTTTASLIAHILMKNGYKVGLLGTRGFFINGIRVREKGLTTPMVLELYTLLEEARECDFFVMEVSSHAITQNRIASVPFDVKILTNITGDHLDFHKTLEEYICVKNSFFDGSCMEILNLDEPNLRTSKTHTVDRLHNNSKTSQKITYGIKNADFTFQDFSISPLISAQIISPTTKAHLKFPMCGLHNLYNVLASIACVSSLIRLPLERICKNLEDFEGVEGRMEIISISPLIIVDFAHTHDGMEKILESFKGEKIVVLFGAGGDRDKSKRAKMGQVAQKYAHKIYLTSDNPRSENPQTIIAEIAQGISDKKKITSCNPDRQESIHQALRELQKDEILFVLGKGDETYQVIGEKLIPFDDREVIRSVIKSENF